MANSKGLEKWFPLIPGYRVHNNVDIQGEIRIEIMFYDQVGEKKWFTINGQSHSLYSSQQKSVFKLAKVSELYSASTNMMKRDDGHNDDCDNADDDDDTEINDDHNYNNQISVLVRTFLKITVTLFGKRIDIYPVFFGCRYRSFLNLL